MASSEAKRTGANKKRRRFGLPAGPKIRVAIGSPFVGRLPADLRLSEEVDGQTPQSLRAHSLWILVHSSCAKPYEPLLSRTRELPFML
jgi:hypothetical protein